MGLFDRQQKQSVLRLCEDRKIKRQKIPVMSRFLIDATSLKAWFRFRRFYEFIQGMGSKLWLILDERDALPVSPYQLYDKSELKEPTDGDVVALDALNYTFGQQEKQTKASRFSDFLSIGIMGLVFTVIIIALLVAAERIDPSQILRNIGF